MREREGLAIAEGPRVVHEALASPVEVAWVLIGARCAESETGRRVLAACEDQGVEVQLLPDRAVRDLASTESPQPVLACARTPVPVRRPLSRGRHLLPLGVRIPGNLGTLVRSAWAFGLDGLVVPPGTVDPWNPKAVRASAGGIFHLPLIAAPDWAWGGPGGDMDGVRLLCADAAGVPVHAAEEARAPDWVLAVGHETGGLPAHVVRRARAISIPMAAGADSLNVAVAGSILMHLLTRRGL